MVAFESKNWAAVHMVTNSANGIPEPCWGIGGPARLLCDFVVRGWWEGLVRSAIYGNVVFGVAR